MATDYISLQAEIADYLARDDLATAIPGFIRLAEQRLNRELRVRQMEAITPASGTGALATEAGGQYLALPTGFLEMRRLILLGSGGGPLSYLTPQDLAVTYGTTSSGVPKHYSVIGGNLAFGPVPGGVYGLEMVYYAKIPALSDAAPANWLLADYPDLYLYGALLEAQPYIMNDERIQIWMGMFDRAIAAVKGEDARARWNGAPLQQQIGVKVF